MNKELIKLEDKAAKLDEVAHQYVVAIAKDASPFTSALVLSQGITALRELLTDDIMSEIMKLANTPLGFLTDRPPGNKAGLKYSNEDVRDAIIEAALRGFRVAGNEFNIIAKRFYAAQVGLHRKVTEYEGVTDFKESFSIPKTMNNGATLNMKASWLKDGVKQELSRDIAVKGDQYASVDSYVGKARRKLYAAVLTQLSGIATPEGEIDDSILTTAEVVKDTELKAPYGPEATAGVWEGKLTMVEHKPYKKEDGKYSEYFVLTIDNGWRASTFSESILEQAEIAIGLDVRLEVKQGRSRSTFNIESFEVLKPVEAAARKMAKDTLASKPKKEQASDDLPFE